MIVGDRRNAYTMRVLMINSVCGIRSTGRICTKNVEGKDDKAFVSIAKN